MNEQEKLLKIAEELERHENFWGDKRHDPYGINLAVAITLKSVRESILSVIVESDTTQSSRK